MFSEKMYGLGSRRSVIRELFEFGKILSAQKGEDKVFDFSLGNPSVPAPACVNEAVADILACSPSTQVHGYTSAPGDASVRSAVADNLNKRYGISLTADNIYMTCGAAASLCISLKALCEDGDEFLLLAPYFPEYEVFVDSAGGRAVSVPFRPEDFQIDFDAFSKALNPRTKAVIVNSPNNPSGVVYTRDTLERLCSILDAKSREWGHPIFIISDEPYRELVYDGKEVPCIMSLYKNSLICYSFSKSLSLPGERIGYIAVNPRIEHADGLFAAICGAGRALGYVCAPSLFQKVVERCLDARPDIDAYRQNRDLLYNALTDVGYECIYPDGAFYLFVKALEQDAGAFSLRAREYGLLLVPGDSFAAEGYVRIAYCVSRSMIERSLPAFRALFESYK